MSWKKNVFSYLLWVLYAVAAEVGLVCLADAVCDSLGVEIYMGTVVCAVYIVLAGAGVFLIHRFAPKYSEAGGNKHSLRTLIFGGTAVTLLAAGFVLRALGAGSVEGTSMYYELAAVGPGRELLEALIFMSKCSMACFIFWVISRRLPCGCRFCCRWGRCYFFILP